MSSKQDPPVIESTGEPLVSSDLWIADPAADEDHRPARTLSEIQPDGEAVDLPEGDQHHDEIANTDPNNHGADTTAPVHTDAEGNVGPQGYGWDSSSLTEAGGPQDESSGQPLVKPPTVEGDKAGEQDEARKASRAGKRTEQDDDREAGKAAKRTSKRSSSGR